MAELTNRELVKIEELTDRLATVLWYNNNQNRFHLMYEYMKKAYVLGKENPQPKKDGEQ